MHEWGLRVRIGVHTADPNALRRVLLRRLRRAMSDQQSMRAVVFDHYGGPDRLALKSVAVPVPDRGEIRVQVHTTTVSRTDAATLRGHPFLARFATGIFRPIMPVLGLDFAGVVDAIGAGVAGFEKGERVLDYHRIGSVRMQSICVCPLMMPLPVSLTLCHWIRP